ncbi:Right handed beta helix region [uncultured archaeon]|nr:Right handed beta helix region [uncultured archaeon]
MSFHTKPGVPSFINHLQPENDSDPMSIFPARIKGSLIVFALALFLSSSLVSASTYYVATDGNDGNSGTSTSSAWKTIQHAADTANGGDTVYVMAGTYNEHVSITKSGSSGNYITFAAYSGQTPVIDGTGKVGNWDGIIHISSANWIRVAGLTVKNSAWNGIMIDNYGGSRASNIIIQNNLIRDIGYTGLYAENSDYITYDGNTVANTQTNGNGGPAGSQQNENVDMIGVNNFEIKNNKIYATAHFESIDLKIGTSTGSVHHNDISPTESAGIYIDAWDAQSGNIDIYDNYIHDSSNAGTRGIAIGAEQGGSAKYINVYNNIVANLAATGINIPWYSKGTVDNVKIINNVVYKTDTLSQWAGGIGIQANTNGGTTTNIIVRNNIVSQNGVAQISNGIGSSATITNNLIDGSGGVTGSNYVTGSPQFVNAAGGDFHLQSSSPAINNGISTDAPDKDYDGKSRPQGNGYDIGAYESGGSSACTPNWQCRQPLDGYEHDANNCGSADRLNSACNAPSTCTPSWKCESPLNGYESDGCNNRRTNSACNPPPSGTTPPAPGPLPPPTSSLGEAVDNTAFRWTTVGDADWFGQTSTYYSGGSSAQSGKIGGGQSTWIKAKATGPGKLKFHWKVSSEPDRDILKFYIDGWQQSKISGDVDWQEKAYSIGPGIHILKWKYSKNNRVSSGSDAAWLDKVEFIRMP